MTTGKNALPGQNGMQRATDGFVTTWENTDGKRLTVHRDGPPMEGLAVVCDQMIARDPSYRMISYSTPETIYGDMTGSRADVLSASGHSQRIGLPEVKILGRVGRIDLVHPRLMIHVDKPKRAAAKRQRAAKRARQ